MGSAGFIKSGASSWRRWKRTARGENISDLLALSLYIHGQRSWSSFCFAYLNIFSCESVPFRLESWPLCTLNSVMNSTTCVSFWLKHVAVFIDCFSFFFFRSYRKCWTTIQTKGCLPKMLLCIDFSVMSPCHFPTSDSESCKITGSFNASYI